MSLFYKLYSVSDIVLMIGPKISHSVNKAGWSSLKQPAVIEVQFILRGELLPYLFVYPIVLCSLIFSVFYALFRVYNFFFMMKKKKHAHK